MKQKQITIDPVDVDANGITTIQVVAGAEELLINGALTVGGVFIGDYARQIGILSSGNDAGITFTVTGTDADGKVQTEAITGAAGGPGTSESTKYFKTITSILSSGAAAANVTVGTVDEFITNTIPIDNYAHDPATVSIEAIVGTIDLTVQESFSRIQYIDVIEWQDGPTALTDITADAAAEMTAHASALRVQINSYSSGAQVSIVINQNRCS